MQTGIDSDSDSSIGEAPSFAAKPLLARSTASKSRIEGTATTNGNGYAGEEQLSLEVQPRELRFEEIQSASTYRAVLRVRNTSLLPQRIRVSKPKTRHFLIDFEPAGPVAPGLEVIVDITCCVPENYNGEDLVDVVVVQGQNMRVQVPLIARAPRANIVFESFVNLGVFGLGCPVKAQDHACARVSQVSSHTCAPVIYYCTHVRTPQAKKLIRFTNEGSIAGSFYIGYDKSLPLTITPDQGTIPARGEANFVDIHVEFASSSLGPFRTVAAVKTPQQETPQLLDISAQVVAQILTLVRPKGGGIIDTMDFGTLFYNTTASQTAILVNNRPHPVSFHVSVQSANLSPSDQLAAEDDDGSVKVTPTHGILKPYAQVPIQVDFAPTLAIPDKAFRHEFEDIARQSTAFEKVLTVEAQDVDQTVGIAITGVGCGVDFTMTPRVLRFGDTAVYQRRDIVVTFKNDSQLPVCFRFPKVAHFKVQPHEGTLAAGQTQPFTVSFIPPQLGEFKSKIRMILENGIAEAELRVMGNCTEVGERRQLVGGPTALPEHFAPAFRFVNPKELPKSVTKKFIRPRPWERMDLHESLAWDEKAPQTAREATGADFTYSIQEQERRAEHRASYHAYLRESRQKREQRLTAPTPSEDPFGVDLGMDKGLDEPDLPIPAATEGLYLQNAVNGDQSNPRQRIPLDENKLIAKKFRPSPGTQAEFRDCDTELTSEQLHKIVASHKVLNFGQTWKTSSVAKSFAIVNDHTASILVTIDTTDKELKECGPRSQTIPAGAVAGFDIRLLALVEGPIRQTVQWTINGRHTFKLIIVAEVVPLEVVLSVAELHMAFPDDCLEPSISESIQLRNTGNVAAEYTWANSGSFGVLPESGIIPAHSTQDVRVVWTPTASFPNKQTLQLSVLNGLDKALQVTGDLGDVKCQFESKKLDFGACPIKPLQDCMGENQERGSSSHGRVP